MRINRIRIKSEDNQAPTVATNNTYTDDRFTARLGFRFKSFEASITFKATVSPPVLNQAKDNQQIKATQQKFIRM